MSGRQRKRREQRRVDHSRAAALRRRALAAGGLAAGATLTMSGVAQAAPQTYTVGTNADSSSGGACTTPTNTDCSLREAVTLANGNAGADTIVFNSNLTGTTITLTSGEIEITEGLYVNGPGASQLTITAGGNSRIFEIDPTSSDDPVSISGLTLTDGDAGSYSGGSVNNEDAVLTISNAVISGSYATGTFKAGGGVYTHHGPLTLDNSTVGGNYAYYGGGIGAGYGALTVTDSTISGNYATDYGGGIWTGAADLTVRNSTISANDAYQDGGGIYSSFISPGGNGNPVTLENTTITGNHALGDEGGGVWICCGDIGDRLTVVSSTLTGNTAATRGGGLRTFLHENPLLQNSIVSGNTGDPTSDSDLAAGYANYLFDTAFSLVGVPSFVNTTVPGSNLFSVDPQLGPLADNGGPTLTHLPADTSPVINKGSSFGLTTDQRGLPRPVVLPGVPCSTAAGADGADMGAVELQTSQRMVCPPAPSGAAGPTGAQAAALASCKKKYRKQLAKKRANDALTDQVKQRLKKKLKKCKRRARQLPV